MEKTIYSEHFYVNDISNKGMEYAKSYVEAFMKKPPKKLFDYLEQQNHFGKVNPEFQAVIIGEPKVSLFGNPQAAVLIVNSNFIAYTTTSDYAIPVGVNYGYATFDNDISVAKVENHLEMNIPYETFLFGVGSHSIEEDYRVLNELLEKNTTSIDHFYEVLEKREEEVVQELEESLEEEHQQISETDEELNALKDHEPTPEPFVVPVPSEEYDELPIEDEMNLSADDELLPIDEDEPAEENDVFLEEESVIEDEPISPVEEEWAIDEEDTDFPEDEQTFETESENEDTEPLIEEMEDDTEQEWGHILMQKNAQGQMEEMKHLPAEQKNQLPAEPTRTQSFEKTGNPIDSRFRTNKPIISNNSIPKGFVYLEPVVYAESVRPGLLKTVTARAGYLKAYHSCLEQIQEEIDAGRFDAVFNLRFTTQSVENYYDIVVSGDAVVYDNE